MKRVRPVAWVAVTITAACASPDLGIEQAASGISEEDLLRRVEVLAHDSMRGRDTPSIELDAAAAWAAAELEAMGLRGGAADGSFIQRYPVGRATVDVEGSSFTSAFAELRYGPDLAPVDPMVSADAEGDLLLVSGSLRPSPTQLSRLRGMHTVLVLPPGLAGFDASTSRLVFGMRDAGAASVSVAVDVADSVWHRLSARALRPGHWKGWAPAPRVGRRPVLQIRLDALRRLLGTAEVDLVGLQARAGSDVALHSLPGASARLVARVQISESDAPNVVGILDGSDPGLAEEHVVFSAHIDHIGVGPPDATGDSIFNGADDDASGTAVVMEVGEAMAALGDRPRRSTIFLLVSGEEKGLWGSEWYAENPSVPIDRHVANLNADMVGRNWPDTIVAIGKEHSDLGATLERVNRAHPELGMTAIDDLWPEENFYSRSDHFNFARRGVPVLFFFNGTHPDYHGRDDEADRVDAEKAARIGRLLFHLGLEVGNADQAPEWDPASYRRIVSGGR